MSGRLMLAKSFEPVWLTFTGRAIVYPCVYRPYSQFTDNLKFSIGAAADRLIKPENDLIPVLLEQFTNSQGLIKASSINRPEIECYDVPRLVGLLAGLDARNVNRDRIFKECPLVSIAVSPYRYDLPNKSFGYALMLHKLQISLPIEIDEDVLK